MKLEIIIASTRPGRLGSSVGAWFETYAKAHSDFKIGVSDLATINLPMLDEPLPPIMDQYANNHTKAWAKRIAAADAFVIVTPEYNFAAPPALVNAMDYLHKEWKYKPVGFVGYGGVGAARAIEMEKQLCAALHMVPLHHSVLFIGAYAPTPIDPTEVHERAAQIMLDELHKWAGATKQLHAPQNRTTDKP